MRQDSCVIKQCFISYHKILQEQSIDLVTRNARWFMNAARPCRNYINLSGATTRLEELLNTFQFRIKARTSIWHIFITVFFDKSANSNRIGAFCNPQYWPWRCALLTGGAGALGLAYSAKITQPSKNYKNKCTKQRLIFSINMKLGWWCIFIVLYYKASWDNAR